MFIAFMHVGLYQLNFELRRTDFCGTIYWGDGSFLMTFICMSMSKTNYLPSIELKAVRKKSALGIDFVVCSCTWINEENIAAIKYAT